MLPNSHNRGVVFLQLVAFDLFLPAFKRTREAYGETGANDLCDLHGCSVPGEILRLIRTCESPPFLAVCKELPKHIVQLVWRQFPSGDNKAPAKVSEALFKWL